MIDRVVRYVAVGKFVKCFIRIDVAVFSKMFVWYLENSLIRVFTQTVLWEVFD